MQVSDTPVDPTSQEEKTIKTYDQHAEDWAREHTDRQGNGYDFVVAQLKKYLPSGSILEIGAGGGPDAKLLVKAGYKYLGTDAASEMVRVAREANPGLVFEQCNVYDLPELGCQFDGFWACAILLHIPKARIDEALQSIVAVIRPDGVGFISMKDGTNEEFERREKAGRRENRLFAYWSKDDFERALSRNGFTTLWYKYLPVSERTKWHWFIVRRK